MYDTPVTTNCLRWAKSVNRDMHIRVERKDTHMPESIERVPQLFAIFTRALERETLEKLDKLRFN